MLPRHVQACQHSPRREQRWFIYTWKPENPDKKTRIPYSCNSWRCDVCARHESHVTFARIQAAFKDCRAEDLVFFVLTIDRDGTQAGGLGWRDSTAAYRELSRCNERFFKRIRRWMKAEGWNAFGSKWVAVVEQHASGWPHINLVVHSPELAEFLRKDRADRALINMTGRDAILLEGELLRHAMDAEWGRQSTAEAVESKDQIAGYITKCVGRADTIWGEVAKKSQNPLAAPVRFRRLRSGKGFLPPRKKSDATGCLVKRRREDSGDWIIEKVNPPKEPRANAAAQNVINLERRLICDEVMQEKANRALREFGLPPTPPAPVIVFIGDRHKPPDRDALPPDGGWTPETYAKSRGVTRERAARYLRDLPRPAQRHAG